VVNKRIHYSL